MRLKDKVAIVTGASRGIGKTIALTFASEGADVVVNYATRADKAEEVVEEIGSMGRRAMAVKADVSKRSEVGNMVRQATEKFGRIDILVNNAGVSRRVDLLDTTEEDWETVVGVDLRGVLNCIQAVARDMMQRKRGKIVTISSAAGLGSTVPKNFAYCVSKGAIFNLTRRAAFELGKYGINVNCIAPGKIITDMTYTGRSKEEADRVIEEKVKSSVLGKAGTPQDIANAVLFLASDESNFITGQVLVVDGGRTDYLSHSV